MWLRKEMDTIKLAGFMDQCDGQQPRHEGQTIESGILHCGVGISPQSGATTRRAVIKMR